VVIRPALDLSGLASTRNAEDLGVSITKSSNKQGYPACFRSREVGLRKSSYLAAPKKIRKGGGMGLENTYCGWRHCRRSLRREQEGAAVSWEVRCCSRRGLLTWWMVGVVFLIDSV
jgi:hypothetical protein